MLQPTRPRTLRQGLSPLKMRVSIGAQDCGAPAVVGLQAATSNASREVSAQAGNLRFAMGSST